MSTLSKSVHWDYGLQCHIITTEVTVRCPECDSFFSQDCETCEGDGFVTYVDECTADELDLVIADIIEHQADFWKPFFPPANVIPFANTRSIKPKNGA